MNPISNADFRLGLSCLQKLRHQRAGLPSTLGENSLRRLLSEGEGALDALQRAIELPFWVGLDGDASVAPASLVEIKAAIALVNRQGGCRSLYETTIAHGDFFARIDLLRVHRDRLEVVEINPQSWEGPAPGLPLAEIVSQNGEEILSPWIACVQDLAFQVEVMRRWLHAHSAEIGLPGDFPIVPKMILAKAGGVATHADCLANFRVRYDKHAGKCRAEITFEGRNLRSTDLLIEADASAAVSLMKRDAQTGAYGLGRAGIAACMDKLAWIVRSDTWPPEWLSLGSFCKVCEFVGSQFGASGKTQCWGGDVDLNPLHILRLPWATDAQVNTSIMRSKGPALMATFSHLELSELQDRQSKPWRHLIAQERDVSSALLSDRFGVLQAPCETPLWFLDLETARFPIPNRQGGRVNELIPFQFSAHQLPHRDAKLIERRLLPGFLDLESADPRRAIVRALRDQLGKGGPIYHWSPFEHQVISTLARSLANETRREPDDPELVGCCHQLLDRLVDLCGIARLNVFLPETQGSYSMKRFLPVIWSDDTVRAAFARGQAPEDPYHYDDPIDPHQSLPSLSAEFLERMGPEAVVAVGNEGDAITKYRLAMLYYNYVRLFGGHERPEVREQFAAYCGLNSAATVMVFDWLRRVVA